MLIAGDGVAGVPGHGSHAAGGRGRDAVRGSGGVERAPAHAVRSAVRRRRSPGHP